MSAHRPASAPRVVTDLAELAELSSPSSSRGPASSIIEWAVESFAPAPGAHRVDDRLPCSSTWPSRSHPAIEVVFIDTGYHFPETLETVEAVRRRYGLNLRIMTVARHDEPLWQVDPENCCSAVKVGQLDRALGGKAAWMSGLRRAEADSRVDRPDRGPRPARPRSRSTRIATWTDLDVAGLHRRPRHPGEPAHRRRATRRSAASPAPRSPPTPTTPARAAGPVAPRRSAACT